MTHDEELKEQERQGKINEFNQLLSQKDYMGRKVAFEVAEKLKELYPNLSMPNYEKYKNYEELAKTYRNELNKL